MRLSPPIVALALAIHGGCWTSPATRAEPSPTRAAADDDFFAAPVAAFPLHSEWRGEYRCSQGQTAVTLVLDARRDGTLQAVFEFGPTAHNRHVPDGAYRLQGTIRGGPEGTFDIALEPLDWISEPEGYVMVALKARSSRRWSRLVGRMMHASCGALDVRRTDVNVRGAW